MPQSPHSVTSVSLPVALVVSIALAGLYGGLSALLPFVKLDIAMFVVSLIVSFLVFQNCPSSFVLRFAGALLAAGLGVIAMWAVWIALEYGIETLSEIVPKSAVMMVPMIERFSAQRSYQFRSITIGADTLRLMWGAQTAAFAAVPVIGALWPRPQKAAIL